MTALCIRGGNSLYGEIYVQGSKNAALPMIAAALLIPGKTVLKGCPDIADVEGLCSLIRRFGVLVTRREDTLCIDATEVETKPICEEEAKQTRACVLLLGAMLARCGYCEMAYPGGCAIGARPIDYHLQAFECLGVKTKCEEVICCQALHLKAAEINLVFPSVGATQNAILVATVTKGVTRINNAAREPEVIWLCRFLNQAGADITGIGTSHILVDGGRKLHEACFEIPPDRIVAGTYIAAVLAAGGEVCLRHIIASELEAVLAKLCESGAELSIQKDCLMVKKTGRLLSFGKVVTEPYPGFPTDLQSIFLALAATACGETYIEENIFEARYGVVPELIRMGAKIDVDGKCAVVHGTDLLHGAHVQAGDLRAAAALVVAALGAKDTTIITGTAYLERGYENICGILRAVGAEISYEC